LRRLSLPLDLIWFKRGRPLVLHATTEPWKLERAIEELGDSLYRLDPDLVVEQASQTVIHVYALIDPLRAFEELRKSPPAYVARVIPVEAHLRPSTSDALSKAIQLLQLRSVKDVEVEVKVRGDCVDGDVIEDSISRLYTVRRKASWLLRIEYLCPKGVAAVVPDRMDRVERWRKI
jgi:hypothetical protein